MINEEKIEKINEWQNAGFVHELTCITSRHGALVPKIIDDTVILKCPVCDYLQTDIPQFILDADMKSAKEELQKRFGKHFKL